MSNNRLENFVADKFFGKGASTVQQSLIVRLDNRLFKVQSRQRLRVGEEKYHMVDMDIGSYSCEKGTDGSPCAHQSAVVVRYKIKSVNTFPFLTTLSRQRIAKVALGDNAMALIDFYASIHQEKYDHDIGNIESSFKTIDNTHCEERRVRRT